MKRSALIVLASLVSLLMGVQHGRAELILVADRSGIEANGKATIDWSAAGNTGATLLNPFIVNSSSVSVTVSLESGSFYRTAEGDGWQSSFSVGDNLLLSINKINPSDKELESLKTLNKMSLVFDKGIYAGGTQIQAYDLGEFKANLDAFGSDGSLIGSVTQNGAVTFDSSSDGSAPYIGFTSTTPIFKIEISLTESGLGNPPEFGEHIAFFAINQFDFNTNAPTGGPSSPGGPPPSAPAAVPEPTSLAVFGVLTASGAFYGWRRRHQAGIAYTLGGPN